MRNEKEKRKPDNLLPKKKGSFEDVASPFVEEIKGGITLDAVKKEEEKNKQLVDDEDLS